MVKSQSLNHYPYDTMTLTGQGQVSAAPDLAVIRLGVQTTGNDLSQIQSENAEIMGMIIKTLKQAGVSEIETVQYLIDKLYEYEDDQKIDKGYYVRHIIEIKTNNINQVGNIIDTAVDIGSNIVQSITFELSEPDLYYQQALNLAIDNAVEKAKSISSNLNTRLNPIPIRIIEGNIPLAPMMQLQREAVSTPIVPGQLIIEASVTADFSYA